MEFGKTGDQNEEFFKGYLILFSATNQPSCSEVMATKSWEKVKIRPDTRPSVADGWAAAEMRVFPLFNSMVTHGPMDRPTDRPTDERTKPVRN